ncbi:GlxA family transcriptional regulator [Streptomyces sp. NPDC020983]|uniref:GlxA family transcriptional regulator n=1 Tax=Streptomyces sp. NPDC020983 TaxID=3365106 RepID=UPI00379EAC6D
MPGMLLAMHGETMLYEVAIATEVLGATGYDFTVATSDGRPHPWLAGKPTASYAALAGAGAPDTVVVPSTEDLEGDPDPRLCEALRTAHGRGARVAALCTGSFVLAAAGLLDGRTATTHWMHAEALSRRFPAVRVRADVLFTDEGDVLTSAGKTAALDLCLHLVRTDLGAAVANQVARRLVVPSLRAGGQAQFIVPPALPRGSRGLAPALEWARAHLDQPLTVADLAGRAGLSPRQLARRMHTEFQTGPLEWLHRQRVMRAQEMLERTDAGMEQIAARCGLGSAATLRRHFARVLGVTPTAYRASFGGISGG